MSRPERVAVIGGGITGLAAALAVVDAGRHAVVFERDGRLGGKLRTSPFAGHPGIDEGPDAFLARLPWGTALARRVGLGEQLVSPAAGKAAVWYDRLHPIPDGLMLGLPTGVAAMARSTLVPWRGKVRAAVEPLLPRSSVDHDSLGGFVRARFGADVHTRLVDPLVGSIYAADTDHFSLAAVPQIAQLAGSARSMLLAGRKAAAAAKPAPGASPSPVFYAPQGGMGSLATAATEELGQGGAEIRVGTEVTALEADDTGWRVDGESFDAVVLACPARAAARLIASAAPDVAAALDAIPSADVAIVTLAVATGDWPAALTGMSGYLVPKPVQQLVTAASFGSQKWAHWALPGAVVLRVSLGRDGLPVLHLHDDRLLGAAVEEVGHHLGLTLQPLHARVSRWPGAFPQYRPHHASRVAAAQAALPAGVALAGASYHGIGVPACVNSAQRAAQRLLGLDSAGER